MEIGALKCDDKIGKESTLWINLYAFIKSHFSKQNI